MAILSEKSTNNNSSGISETKANSGSCTEEESAGGNLSPPSGAMSTAAVPPPPPPRGKHPDPQVPPSNSGSFSPTQEELSNRKSGPFFEGVSFREKNLY